jgi:hypothetical protein
MFAVGSPTHNVAQRHSPRCGKYERLRMTDRRPGCGSKSPAHSSFRVSPLASMTDWDALVLDAGVSLSSTRH